MPDSRVLVLDGEERASLAVARSLSAAGFRVSTAARSSWALAARTRGVERVVLGGMALAAPLAYAAEIAELAARLGASLVIPVTDASLEATLEHRQLFAPGTTIPVASRDVYRAASDKLHVHRIACEVGIGIDETIVVEHGEQAPADPRLYPGVVKPHRSVVGTTTRHKTSVRAVDDRDACSRALEALPPEEFPVLVQRRVRGPGEGFFTARWNGATIANFAHRRLREKPPAGGVSVFRESIPLDPGLQRACDALLDRLEWDGVAMVELKRDLDRGGWRVMEINGRFWGSLQLAIDAGVDFPALLANAALGGSPAAPPAWRSGVRLRWEWGDVDHLLIRLLRSRARLGLPPEAPGRLAAIGAFLSHLPARDRLEIFRLGDPMPFVAESLARLGVVG